MSENQTGENNTMYGRIGSLNPNYGNRGSKNQNSKTYTITFPDGHEETIRGLAEFCRIHKLTPTTMISVDRGKQKQHKGFKCRCHTNSKCG